MASVAEKEEEGSREETDSSASRPALPPPPNGENGAQLPAGRDEEEKEMTFETIVAPLIEKYPRIFTGNINDLVKTVGLFEEYKPPTEEELKAAATAQPHLPAIRAWIARHEAAPTPQEEKPPEDDQPPPEKKLLREYKHHHNIALDILAGAVRPPQMSPESVERFMDNNWASLSVLSDEQRTRLRTLMTDPELRVPMYQHPLPRGHMVMFESNYRTALDIISGAVPAPQCTPEAAARFIDNNWGSLRRLSPQLIAQLQDAMTQKPPEDAPLPPPREGEPRLQHVLPRGRMTTFSSQLNLAIDILNGDIPAPQMTPEDSAKFMRKNRRKLSPLSSDQRRRLQWTMIDPPMRPTPEYVPLAVARNAALRAVRRRTIRPEQYLDTESVALQRRQQQAEESLASVSLSNSPTYSDATEPSGYSLSSTVKASIPPLVGLGEGQQSFVAPLAEVMSYPRQFSGESLVLPAPPTVDEEMTGVREFTMDPMEHLNRICVWLLFCCHQEQCDDARDVLPKNFNGNDAKDDEIIDVTEDSMEIQGIVASPRVFINLAIPLPPREANFLWTHFAGVYSKGLNRRDYDLKIKNFVTGLITAANMNYTNASTMITDGVPQAFAGRSYRPSIAVLIIAVDIVHSGQVNKFFEYHMASSPEFRQACVTSAEQFRATFLPAVQLMISNIQQGKNVTIAELIGNFTHNVVTQRIALKRPAERPSIHLSQKKRREGVKALTLSIAGTSGLRDEKDEQPSAFSPVFPRIKIEEITDEDEKKEEEKKK